MLYEIGLVIRYEYDRPAGAGRNLLRLMPADLPGEQRRHWGRLDIHPEPADRRDMLDFFGNAAVELAFRESHAEISFEVAARVERLSIPAGFDMSPDLDRLAWEVGEYRGLDAFAPHHFVIASPEIAPMPATTAYAREQVQPGMSVREIVGAIGAALNRDMTYDPEATTVETPPGEAFARRHGVCQDFAQVMIAALRGLGIPAGYVSGFLRTLPPPGAPRLEGADAMHAWVRAWCGWEAGWLEYDPTNAMFAGTDHIVIARGRDYQDVAPVRGVLRTSGGQTTEQAVDVVQVAA